jgi:hypothetical protein
MEKEQPPLDEKILRRIPKEIGVVTLVLAFGSLIMFDLTTALLVLAGGGVAVIGFLWLKASVDRFLDQSKPRALKTAVFLYGLRLLLIILVFSIIILFFSKKIFALAAGFSSIVAVFLFEAAAAFIQMKKWKP